MKKLRCVLLVDDHDADNYIHRRLIRKAGIAERTEVALHGGAALEFLTTKGPDGTYPRPELILLDINMPRMNGWEFLQAYEALPEDQTAGVVVVMLTTSLNPDDADRAERIETIDRFLNKPLTRETLFELLEERFPGRFSPDA